MSSVGLLERDAELGRIDELLHAAGGGNGGLLVIPGPAGIGKTSLLEACAERASTRGMRVLRVRGDELVMESSFAAVRELLWQEMQKALAGGDDVLDGAAALALPVFEGDASERVGPERAGSVLHGLYWLVANLADRRPALLLIDDAHCLDAASGRFLVYLARRVDTLPVLLAVALRPGEGADPDTPLEALSGLAAEMLRPEPLSEDACGVVVRRGLGARADDELCRSCFEATGGNPFYLRELTSAIESERGRPTVAAAERVRALGAGVLGKSVLVRLSRLGLECGVLAQAVAVLAPGSPLRHAATLAGLDRGAAEAAADRLRVAELLAAQRALAFAHPIVHEAVLAELAPSRRAALHAQAARLLFAESGPSEGVAAHLLFAEPYREAWVVDALRGAARRALAQGAPESAVSYLRRALIEPPSSEERLQLLLELGRAEALMPMEHDFGALPEALQLAGDPEQRAEISLELALALFGAVRSRAGRVVLEEALEREDELESETVERLDQTLIGGGVDDLSATLRLLTRAERYFERARDGEIDDPRMLSTLALVGTVTGSPAAEMAALARLALRDERLLSRWMDDGYVTAVCALCWTDQLGDAAQAADAGIAEAQRRGSAPMFVQLATMRAETALRAGDLDVAEDNAERALELGRELKAEHVALLWLPMVLLERGRPDEAAELIESIELTDSVLGESPGVILLAHRGRVRIALDDCEAGWSDLREADRRMAAAGCQLSVLTDWVPSAVRALVRLGRGDRAMALAKRELADATAFGAGRRRGVALSTSGLLDGGEQGLAWLQEAAWTLERSPAHLEHARALVNLGAGLGARGRREEARAPLSQGLDLAHRCGASVVAQRARTELIASGARPRRDALRGVDALTPAELRAAQMAAQGLSNRQIAQALFVSTKAVEGQLSHAYAKLGIRGRGELADALRVGEQGVGVGQPRVQDAVQSARVPPPKLYGPPYCARDSRAQSSAP